MRVIILFLAVCFSISLLSCSSGGGGGNSADLSSDPCSSLIDLPSVGLACLHCTQPQAHDQARILAGVLLRSCVKNISTNFLVDNTFEYNEAILDELISSLAQGGRNLFVTFFLGNGPAQDEFDTTQIQGFGAQISPADFRTRIQTDEQLRSQYRSLVTRILPVIQRAQSQGVTIAVIPVLEDNLTDTAFNAMRDLTLEALGSTSASIGRNSCFFAGYPRTLTPCQSGSEFGVPTGVFAERHSVGPIVIISNGIVSNDGIEYDSEATGPLPEAPTTLRDLQNLRELAEGSGNTFILWHGRHQGLVDKFHEESFPLPADRTYYVPTSREQDELIRFFRKQL